jgi:hypothetical protein
MLNIIFTLDYEIHGSGEGSPDALMVEPTRRLMRSMERHGAKLTIMAEVAEIAQFKRYAAVRGIDRFHAGMIEDQLREAVGRSHDVQLHIHPAYYGACWAEESLELNWTEYDLARLGYERLAAMIGDGRAYLESLLRPVVPGYACIAFRAGNWSMQPSADIVRALRDQGIRVDTSVFKYGSRSGLVHFDYSKAFSNLVPWPVDPTEICLSDPHGELWEVPIYCESRWLWDFLSITRFYRIWQGSAHPMAEGRDNRGGDHQAVEGMREQAGNRLAGGLLRALGSLVRKHAWKMDFNQCSGRQLIGALKRIAARYGDFPYPLPVVLIGHSKLFTTYNERDLTTFLEYVAEHTADYRFSTFGELEPDVMRKAFGHERAGCAVQHDQKNAQPGKTQ